MKPKSTPPCSITTNPYTLLGLTLKSHGPPIVLIYSLVYFWKCIDLMMLLSHTQGKYYILHPRHFTGDVNIKMQVHDGRLFPLSRPRRLNRAADCSVGDESCPSQHVLRLPRSLTPSTDIATRDTAHDNY